MSLQYLYIIYHQHEKGIYCCLPHYLKQSYYKIQKTLGSVQGQLRRGAQKTCVYIQTLETASAVVACVEPGSRWAIVSTARWQPPTTCLPECAGDNNAANFLIIVKLCSPHASFLFPLCLLQILTYLWQCLFCCYHKNDQLNWSSMVQINGLMLAVI